jgi:hypothetical protein
MKPLGRTIATSAPRTPAGSSLHAAITSVKSGSLAAPLLAPVLVPSPLPV